MLKLFENQSSQATKPPPPPPPRPKGDRLSVSSQLQELSASSSDSAEEVDMAAVEQLRRDIQEGNYEVDDESLLDAMLSELHGLEAIWK